MGGLWSDITEYADDGISYDELLSLLCHVGHAGELFTSAAPYDPIFWPLHGMGERFAQLARWYGQEGIMDLDMSWGYYHSTEVPSDTELVCDWSGIERGSNMMPVCTLG